MYVTQHRSGLQFWPGCISVVWISFGHKWGFATMIGILTGDATKVNSSLDGNKKPSFRQKICRFGLWTILQTANQRANHILLSKVPLATSPKYPLAEHRDWVTLCMELKSKKKMDIFNVSWFYRNALHHWTPVFCSFSACLPPRITTRSKISDAWAGVDDNQEAVPLSPATWWGSYYHSVRIVCISITSICLIVHPYVQKQYVYIYMYNV